MAIKWVLVICPDNCAHPEDIKVAEAFEKIKAEGGRPFMFPANDDRRALEEDAIRRKFPDKVVFTNKRRSEIQHLLQVARQWHLTK